MNKIISNFKSKKFVLLICFLFAIGVTAQEQTVTGVVSDENGIPLPGVNVVVKGTNNGTQTNFDGEYEIDVANSDEVLVFSYIGFQTHEVQLDGRSTIDISLETDQESLDEVVVVGYGTVKKSDLTGADRKSTRLNSSHT